MSERTEIILLMFLGIVCTVLAGLFSLSTGSLLYPFAIAYLGSEWFGLLWRCGE